VSDYGDLYLVGAAAIHHTIRAHEDLADVLAPKLWDHVTRVRELRQRPYSTEQSLEPFEGGGGVIGRDMGDGGVDLRVRLRGPRDPHFK